MKIKIKEIKIAGVHGGYLLLRISGFWQRVKMTLHSNLLP
jgi:hypothetical protein